MNLSPNPLDEQEEESSEGHAHLKISPRWIQPLCETQINWPFTTCKPPCIWPLISQGTMAMRI